MEYCPEIAVLHGAFALVTSESRHQSASDLAQHQKGHITSPSYLVIKDAVQEITSGLESVRALSAQKIWRRRLFQIFIHKTFESSDLHVSHDLRISSDSESDVRLKLCDISKSDDAKAMEMLECARIHLKTSDDAEAVEMLESAQIHVQTSDDAKAVEMLESAQIHLQTSVQKLSKENKFKSVCCPLPQLHPFFLFDLMKDMDWGEYFGEELSKAELSTSLKFAQACLDYISSEPTTAHDVDLIGVTLNFLVSCCFSEIMQGDTTNGQSLRQMPETSEGRDLLWRHFQLAPDWECRHFDEESASLLTEILIKLLEFARQRMVLEALEKNQVLDKGLMNFVRNILPCVFVLGIVSCSTSSFSQLAKTLSKLFVEDVDDDGNSREKGMKQSDSEISLNGAPAVAVTAQLAGFEQCLFQALRDLSCQSACLAAISTILNPKRSQAETESWIDTTETLPPLGSMLDLEFQMMGAKPPLKMVYLLREFRRLIHDSAKVEGSLPMFAEEVESEMDSVLTEIERREEEEEKRRQNPSLPEVMDRVQKRLPRWKRCLDYGLAKRDLHGWWFSGFLDLLRGNHQVLHRESDVEQLMGVVAEAVLNLPDAEMERNITDLTELIVTVFTGLPLVSQEKIILKHYQAAEAPFLPLVGNFDQELMVAFNKLSATSTQQDLQRVLRLALHDPLTFVQHAVQVAVSSAGQISLVVRVLRLMPNVCRCVCLPKSDGCSLLHGCLRATLDSHELGRTEQKNLVTLVSSLVQTFEEESIVQCPLLSPTEFLATSALPYISLHTLSPISHLSTDFALRILIGVLESTLCVGFSNWLRETHPATLIGCCGELLDDCVELVSDAGDVDLQVRIKSLVLTVLELLRKHLCAGKECLADGGLCWVQEKCAALDWTVSAYLADFIIPTADTTVGDNQLLTHLAAECVREVDTDLLPLLRLAAVSDEAETQVLRSVRGWTRLVSIHEAVVLNSLCKLLPHLLVSEVRRVTRVLSALVSAGGVDVTFRCLFSDSFSIIAFRESHAEVCVSQLLMDACVLMQNSPAVFTSSAACLHLAQVLVAALQELLTSVPSRRSGMQSGSFHHQVFSHVCVVMSAVPDVMQESLFVVLLDLVKKLQNDVAENLPTVCDVVKRGIRLLPKDTMRETSKRLGRTAEV